MPEISLKPKSPEFANQQSDSPIARCDMPGCAHDGENKAPKHRGLDDYYWFCKEHVSEYNKAWNFFEGMADSEVENHMHQSLYGDRPTWKYGVNGTAEEALYNQAWQTFTGSEEPRNYKPEHDPQNGSFSQHSQEHKAMALMGLEPPITLAGVKTRYKELAKKHHPDLNHGCPKSEELLKEINMAYTILKLAYEKFDALPERT